VAVVDVEGNVGSKVNGALSEYLDGAPRGSKLREYLDANSESPLHGFLGARFIPFELVRVRAGERAKAKGKVFHKLRDRLCGNLEEWLRGDPGQDNGGAIPEDPKLSAELHVLVWDKVDDGPLRLLDKREIRKILGRSPDRYDALALSVWEPRWVQDEADGEEDAPPPPPKPAGPRGHEDDDAGVGGDDTGLDPYARPLDPYGR
jgi:hypothetical protein